MPPRTASGPRRAGTTRTRRQRTYNVAGVIDIQETGALAVTERIERIVRNAKDPRTILGAVEPLEAAERRLFAEAGQGHWKPTAPQTTREKQAKGLHTEPMRATDALYQSLTSSQAKGAIRRPLRRGTQLRFGSSLVQGVMQKRAGRDPVAIDEKGRDAVVEQIRDRLLG